MNHNPFIHHCLELANKGRGQVGSNPLVGAVLVRGEEITAEGFYAGGDHAERELFKKFDQEIQQEDVLYVNLEPCCHTGQTPPCTDLIIEKGIKTVVYGMQDPDERVAGQGIYQLIDRGVTVIGPIERAACERLNRGYISLRTNSKPFITIKKAQTLDGRVANDDGSKLCITTDAQNEWSHTHLRSTHDAILVGVQTVITDNPLLTNRITNHQPYKIILDPELRIPRDATLIDDRTIIITQKESEEIGEAKVITVPMIDDHFDWDALWNALPNVSSILVEGGSKTWETFTKAHLIDEEVILVN